MGVVHRSKDSGTWNIPYLDTEPWEVSYPEMELDQSNRPCYDLRRFKQDRPTKERTEEESLDTEPLVFRARLPAEVSRPPDNEQESFPVFRARQPAEVSKPPDNKKESFPRVLEVWERQNSDIELEHPMFQYNLSSPPLQGDDLRAESSTTCGNPTSWRKLDPNQFKNSAP